MLANEKISEDLRHYAENLADEIWGDVRVLLDPLPMKRVDPHAPWYIAFAQPRRETVAEASLREDGFECFYPVRNVTVLPHRKTVTLKMRNKLHLLAKSVDRPVFPGYLFIRPGVSDPGLRRIFDLRGVAGIVRFGEDLARVSNDLVESLRSGDARKAIEEHYAITAFPFKVGDKGVLTDGALKEHTAVVNRIDESSGVIHALVRLFGRECRVVTSVDQFEKIS